MLRTLGHANLKTIHYVLRTLIYANPPRNMTQARDVINELATATHAMQTTVATTVGSNSRFSCLCLRDVFENATDYWLAGHYTCLWISCQMIIYNVPIGSNVRMTKLRDNKFWRSTRPTKLGVRMEGPSTIECVHVNGNLTTLLREGITKCINIRRVLSYCWPFHIPLWRQFLAWIVFEVFTFYLWSFFSTSHLSEL